ncbi:unnamed protein product, partial [Mesorhabditis belari]|uniref:G protein-coupled receptor n=1 Tax=Mesorhabditis belari TaxID=2138241 RepID=A0AAF3FAS1_9BILA
MSEKTRSLQKRLFRTLCIQTAIPVASHTIPWAYYAIVIIWSPGYINQPLNNFFFAIFEMHGTNGSIALLLLTEPYRRFIRGMLRKIPVLGKFTTLDLTRIHIFGTSSGTEQ